MYKAAIINFYSHFSVFGFCFRRYFIANEARKIIWKLGRGERSTDNKKPAVRREGCTLAGSPSLKKRNYTLVFVCQPHF